VVGQLPLEGECTNVAEYGPVKPNITFYNTNTKKMLSSLYDLAEYGHYGYIRII